MMERGGHKDAAHIHALMIEYLEWSGMEGVAEQLTAACHARGLPVARDLDSRSSSRASRPGTADDHATDLPDQVLAYFDSGQGAKFFQAWRLVRERSALASSLEVLTLEFYLHVYFATLPLRHGHKKDHPAAMAVFRRFLETCPPRVGTVQDLLPFYALPYVLDPTLHPAFRPVFQDSWVRELRGRLCGFLGRRPTSFRPAIFSYLHHHRHHASSVGAALVAQESAASAVRSQRTLRRRLQRLQEDYQKLIGVSWELTQALETAVRGERVDLEGTLAACTHRYPELFTLTLTADTTAGPATILLESMQRCRRRPGIAAPVSALDFERVRADLAAAPETHVLLLLQALRHRVTRVTTGSVRQAVVTAYVRGDVLGLRGSCRSWSRLSGALASPQPQLMAQAAARLINSLTAFTAGRSYLAREEVCSVLLGALRAEHPDLATTDMALAALQKLSIRGVVQAALIEGGAVEWLVDTLSDAHSLTPYTQEYAAALLMNLTLRSAGRARCHPLGPSLLPALTHLLTSVPSHVVPYVTGALYSLLSHPSLRQDAFDIGLDSTLERLAQGGSTEQLRQLEYIVEQIRRDPPLSPPPSPDPVLDMEEDPEWLEEELDMDDPVRAPAHSPAGEDLLTWRYTLHPGDSEDADRRRDIAPTRSAPAIPWDSPPQPTTQRPNSDGFVVRHHQSQLQQQQAIRGQWDYPSDSDAGHSSMYTACSNFTHRSSEMEGGEGEGGDEGSNGCGGSGSSDTGPLGGSKEVEEWAISLRGGRSPTLPRHQNLQGHHFSVATVVDPLEHPASETEESTGQGSSQIISPERAIHNARPGTACPAEALTYLAHPSSVHEDHFQDSPGTAGINHILVKQLHGNEDDITIMSRSDADLPVNAAEQQHPSSHDSSLRLSTMHESIIEEEDETGRSSLEDKDASHVVSPPEMNDADLQYNSTVGTTSREGVPVEVTDDAMHHKSKPLAEDEQGTAQEEHEGEQNEGFTGGENEIKVAEEKPVQFQLPAAASVYPPTAERVESVICVFHRHLLPVTSPTSEGDIQHVCMMKASGTPKQAPSGTHSSAPSRAPEKMLPRRASVSPHRLSSHEAHKGYDLVATRLLQQLVGESRDMTAPSSIPDGDPLLRSLPPPKVSEYKVAFSSRPRIARTPPGSAVGRRVTQASVTVSAGTPSSPRHILPPISRTNHTYTRAAT
ncbi:lisH domain-containing protein ARMC9-like isoform X2 [Panulirus ornatus]|uniref:lisH domain-containing protein ARMC9-like isoform X2 n=1 Tax=Panulirus ornatus TaxID=150431 RepID=UPI003A839532